MQGKMWFSVLMLGLILMWGSQSMAGGKYKLAYKFNKGDQLRYKIETSMENVQERMGQEIQINIDGESVMLLQGEGRDEDGNVKFLFSIESVKSHIQSPMGDTTVVNPPELLGKRKRMILSELGKRIKVEEVDTLVLTGLMAQVGGQQNSLQFPVLTKESVGVGSSWTAAEVDSQVNRGMKVHIRPTTTYTVEAEVDTLGYKCLRIRYKGTVKMTGEGQQMGMKIVLDGDGENGGVLYFAPKEGRLVYVDTASDIDMNVALTGQMNMTMPSTIATRAKMVLLK
ncbi:MAG: hypothetical protein Q9P90_07410 [candidate division KSB1 bacterium]|nr:hypothetical protein [candidate division KSB1 bacterium]